MKTVGYVCMEFALDTNLPIYAGGLGVLAGDLILETPKEDMRLIGLGIFYSHGFHAHNEDGRLDPTPFGFETLKDLSGKTKFFSTPLGDSEVWFQVWKKTYDPSSVYLLDTDISINSEEHQKITKHLYGPDRHTMFQQQIILGFGLTKILQAENINPDVYHLNEGHTAMTILGLAKGLPQNLAEVKNKCVATKHTVLTGGGIYIEKDELKKELKFLEKDKVNLDALFELGTNTTHPTTFSTTNFLMRNTRLGSAVSVAHQKAEKQVHPHSNLIAITNGINLNRWQPQKLDPQSMSNQQIWDIHQKNKVKMLEFLCDNHKCNLSEGTLTVSWARRFVSYKRPDLLFKNVDELTKITTLFPSVQFVIAGQTNPSDTEAMDIKNLIKRTLKEKQLETRICFLENYNLEIAKYLVSGSDVWLNTPTPGIEASGTSGMKAGSNGALEFTTLDGWVGEVDWTNTGWILEEDKIAEHLYGILENDIFPLYYKVDNDGLPSEWIERMKKTIQTIEENYTTVRVLGDYFKKLYFPQTAS